MFYPSGTRSGRDRLPIFALTGERKRRREARCRPSVRQDNFGVARYVYAIPGCEFGRLD